MKPVIIIGTLLALSLLSIVTGCGKPKESIPAIVPIAETTIGGKFLNYGILPVVTAEPDPNGVSFEGVGFAAEGAYIMVNFKAPMSQSELWQQDYIWILDEVTMRVYKDIPVMPVVGPLIGRPSVEGQKGYVMLINYQGGIRDGSIVSVVMGNYKRVHVKVAAPPAIGQ